MLQLCMCLKLFSDFCILLTTTTLCPKHVLACVWLIYIYIYVCMCMCVCFAVDLFARVLVYMYAHSSTHAKGRNQILPQAHK